MSFIEEPNSDVSNYNLLFRKSSFKIEWDEKSPERISVPSTPQDVVGQLLRSEEQFGNKTEDKVTASSSNFVPTILQFENRGVSFEVASPSLSVFSDSLEEGTKTSETGAGEDQSEIEEESLEDSQITDELDFEENCEKEGCFKRKYNYFVHKDGDPVVYLDKEVFPVLLPCLEKMLFAAKENDVLKVQKSRFNGLDYLAELLWNCNPLHPERQASYVPLFDIPFVQKHIEEHPRPIIPQSWLWTREQAAVVIQAAARGYLVRCQPQVQEMRQFWKALAVEKQLSKEKIQSEAKYFGRNPIVHETTSTYSRYQEC